MNWQLSWPKLFFFFFFFKCMNIQLYGWYKRQGKNIIYIWIVWNNCLNMEANDDIWNNFTVNSNINVNLQTQVTYVQEAALYTWTFGNFLCTIDIQQAFPLHLKIQGTLWQRRAALDVSDPDRSSGRLGKRPMRLVYLSSKNAVQKEWKGKKWENANVVLRANTK